MSKILSKFSSTSKINLYLDIIGKDPKDGYHFLESIFYEIPLGDDIIVSLSDKDEVIFYNNTDELIPQENTVSKALRLFKSKFNIKDHLKIEVYKKVPMGAGLGGGSGDAGCLIKWLASYYKIDIEECIDIAKQVGSDVPFFLYGGTALVEGKGEKITKLDNRIASGMNIVIIYPGVHTSTKKAFEALKFNNMGARESIKEKKFLKKSVWDIDNLNNFMYNIFDNYLELIDSDLNTLKNQICNLLSPKYLMLTGSGSSFILLTKEEIGVLQTKEKIGRLLNSCSSIYVMAI